MRMLLAAAAMAILGCNVNQATITGHDFIEQAASALSVGIEEYHADDLERMTTARRLAADAFARDVLAVADDSQKVRQTTQQFLDLLEKAERACEIERQRHLRLQEWLEKLLEVNSRLREQAERKLLMTDQAVGYVRQLREKANVIRPGKQPD